MNPAGYKITIFSVILFLFIAAGAGVVYVLKDSLARSFIEQAAEWMTGSDAVIQGEVQMRLIEKKITIERMDIMNFSGFESPVLAQITGIEINYSSIAAVLWDKKHPSIIRAHIEAIHVETNASGAVNLSQLKAVSETAVKLPLDHTGFFVGKLDLSYGSIYYHERRPDLVKEDIEVDLRYQRDAFADLKDPNMLVQIPVLSTITALKKGSLGIPRSDIQDRIRGTG